MFIMFSGELINSDHILRINWPIYDDVSIFNINVMMIDSEVLVETMSNLKDHKTRVKQLLDTLVGHGKGNP